MSYVMQQGARQLMVTRRLAYICLTFLTGAGLATLPACSHDNGPADAITGGASGAPVGGSGSGAGGVTGTGGTKGGSGGANGGGADSGGSGGAPSGTGATGPGGSGTGGGSSSDGGTSSGGSGLGGAAGGGGSPGGESWDFASSPEGWTAGFCDYPEGEDEFYKLAFDWAELPSEVGGGGGLRISGSNHSDDLFMFIFRSLTGLLPETTYTLNVAVDIATNAPIECGGIGGSPGVSVYFKIGASSIAPGRVVDSGGKWRLNLDKGNQAIGGSDLLTVGDIGNTLPCEEPYPYEPKRLTLTDFPATTSADGTLWIVIGTDSGFEGLTTLYYDRVEMSLRTEE